MSGIKLIRIFIVLFLFHNGSFLIAQKEEKRLALLIGNSEYELIPLKNAVYNINLLGKELKKTGFEVHYCKNCNNKDLLNSISSFASEFDSITNAAVIVYYSGHGIQWQGKNFLIPIGAHIESEHDLLLETIELELILNKVCLEKNFINIMILDVPPLNHVHRQLKRYRSNGLAAAAPPENTILAYSAASQMHHQGYNSIYFEAFLKVIKLPTIEIYDFFKKVRSYVLKHTNGSQIPWETSNFTGEFYFNND